MRAWQDRSDRDEVRAVAAAVARERYAPKAADGTPTARAVPIEERRYLGSLGFLGIALPERFGGAGAPLLDALVVVEELAKECRPAAFQVFEANTGPAQVVNLLGTEEQRERYLPAIVRGRQARWPSRSPSPTPAPAPPTCGTRAKYTDGVLRLNGLKRWISNGGEADHYLVYCRLADEPGARGIGALVVEAGPSRGQLRRAGRS